MKNKIEIKTKQLFKIIFWGIFSIYLPFGLINSFLALTGEVPTVIFQDEPAYGIKGFIGQLCYILLLPFLWALINTILVKCGLSIYNNLIVKLFGNKNSE